MIKILVNDGIHPDGKIALEKAGFQVDTNKIAQDNLPAILPAYDAIIVRSATKVRRDLIDHCPNLKVIARGGVGLDNIDVDYARNKGIQVLNTPAASSLAVAELVFGHVFSLARSLHLANREMPSKGGTEFNNLKKAYSKGVQLRGRTLGIIGFGKIGQETAKIGLSLGMEVVPVDIFVEEADLAINLFNSTAPITTIKLKTVGINEMLKKADVISLHVPFTGKPVLGTREFSMMKDGVLLINASRGGAVDEAALLEALNNGKVAGAGLDVFEKEPTPKVELLNHPKISLSPHIGASTLEAQRNIGLELAEQITAFFS